MRWRRWVSLHSTHPTIDPRDCHDGLTGPLPAWRRPPAPPDGACDSAAHRSAARERTTADGVSVRQMVVRQRPARYVLVVVAEFRCECEEGAAEIRMMEWVSWWASHGRQPYAGDARARCDRASPSCHSSWRGIRVRGL